ncbi:hypothetical protein PLESTF_001468000 [Pleodorina starrii]|nr:hypothetical protein PLESTF_001468000 [Pleodorina starrii]
MADKALLAAMFRSTCWTHLPDLLQRHQEQHLEATRLAAAAAAAAAAASQQPAASVHATSFTARMEAEEAFLQRSGTAASDFAQPRTSQPDRPGHSQHLDGQAQPSQPQQPPEPAPQHQHQQPAFTARHLATALHVTSLRVSEPRALSHADRVGLAEFLRSLGRGCAGLAAREAFPPVDLAMALRALAKLLGEAGATSSAAASAGGGGGGNQRRRGEVYGNGAGADLSSDEYDGGLFAAGPRRRWGAHEHGDDVEEEDDDEEEQGSWAARGATAGAWGRGRGGPRRGPGAVDLQRVSTTGRRGGLHAAWLDEAWVDDMLEPTLEAFSQDFEPRHVSGVLWALATLGIRPRADLLSALCERAAECAEATIAAGSAGGRSQNGKGHQHGAPAAASDQAMTSQGLSLTLWALARLGFQPGPASLEALLSACELDMRAAAVAAAPSAGPGAVARPRVAASRVAPCCTLDLAQRAWALATLGCHPGEEWLELLVAAFLAQGSVEQISGQSCSMMMWALARLHALGPPAEATVSPAAAASSAADPAGRQQRPASNSDAAARQRGSADSDKPAAADSELLKARAESGKGASTSGRSAASAPAAGRASAGYRVTADQTSPEVDLEAWVTGGGAAVLGIGDPLAAAVAEAPARVAVLRRPGRVASLLGLLQGALPRMSSQHLATVLWALSSMDVRPSQAWLEAFLEASGRRMAAALTDSSQPFGPQSLAMLLGAMARLRYRPPASWMHCFMEVCRKELPAFGPHSACVLAWSLVRLSYRPRGDWRRAFAAGTQHLLPAMSPLGLCLLLWSLASWRSRPTRAWLQTAFAASAEHLHAGAAAWERSAAALEAAQPPGTAAAPPPPPTALRPELLAVLLWSVPHLLPRPPPGFWLSLAESATQAAMRYSRAAATAAATAASAAGSARRAGLASAALEPRELAMLMQGWARLQRPPAAEVLSAALSYIADTASAAVAAAADGIPSAGRGAGPRAPQSAAEGLAVIGPQHVVIVLWSCAVMGLDPPAGLVERLVGLHSELLLLRNQQELQLLRNQNRSDDAGPAAAGPAAAAAALALPSASARQLGGSQSSSASGGDPQGAAVAGAVTAAGGVATAAGGTDGGSGSGDAPSPQQLRQALVARELLSRQAELGMLVWALITFRVASPPAWLPAVLAAVGHTLEHDAAAVASSAAAADTAAGPAPAALRETYGGEAAPALQAAAASQLPRSHTAASAPVLFSSAVSLLTVKTLARACLAWRLDPGARWIAAAGACLDAGALGTKLRRAYGRANLEAEVRYLLEQLQAEAGREPMDGGAGPAGRRRGQGGVPAATWAEAASGAVLTNAMAAVAAGSAAAWMQVLVW